MLVANLKSSVCVLGFSLLAVCFQPGHSFHVLVSNVAWFQAACSLLPTWSRFACAWVQLESTFVWACGLVSACSHHSFSFQLGSSVNVFALRLFACCFQLGHIVLVLGLSSWGIVCGFVACLEFAYSLLRVRFQLCHTFFVLGSSFNPACFQFGFNACAWLKFLFWGLGFNLLLLWFHLGPSLVLIVWCLVPVCCSPWFQYGFILCVGLVSSWPQCGFQLGSNLYMFVSCLAKVWLHAGSSLWCLASTCSSTVCFRWTSLCSSLSI